MQSLDDWAIEKGGRFAHVIELSIENEALTARVRTDFAFDGIKYRVPEDVYVPPAYRAWLGKGEIDHRQLRQAQGQ